MCETNSFARMESLCLFNFGLRSRIRNMFLIHTIPGLHKPDVNFMRKVNKGKTRLLLAQSISVHEK